MPRKPLACKLHHISHLSEGAWIEMPNSKQNTLQKEYRTSQNVRGLKYVLILPWTKNKCRTSNQVRGSK